MLAYEIGNHGRKFHFLGAFQTVIHMVDDNTRTLHRTERIVGIHAMLVFGKKRRIVDFADIVVKRACTHKLHIGTYTVAASEARLLTCIECWKVPGHSSDSSRNTGLLTSLSSTKVTDDTKPNIFSSTNTST